MQLAVDVAMRVAEQAFKAQGDVHDMDNMSMHDDQVGERREKSVIYLLIST